MTLLKSIPKNDYFCSPLSAVMNKPIARLSASGKNIYK